MKIGEILEKTGLTDRAVRLYIEHGLVTPSVEKSYSGRKSIAFTEEDAEKLREFFAEHQEPAALEKLQAQAKNFCRVLDIRVAQVMEPDAFVQTNCFQDFLVQSGDGLRTPDAAGSGRGEQVDAVRMILSVLHQQVHCLLRDDYRSDRAGCLRRCSYQLAIQLDGSLGDLNSSLLHIQIRPEESNQFSASQTGGQFRVEKVRPHRGPPSPPQGTCPVLPR